MSYVRQALQLRLDELKRKLTARKGQPGFKANVAEIEAAIAEIEAELAKAR